MADLEENIIDKNSILLSRNNTVALVVGAGGFLGSNLTDKLLEKGLQVIGVDNFSTGEKENLQQAFKDKNFHFINESAQRLTLDVPRLDYIFIATTPGWSLAKILELAKKHKSKLVFVSTIELYDSKTEEDLSWFKSAESEIASFAAENKLNARIVRLASLYGPRMRFKGSDPMTRLIYATLTQKGQTAAGVAEFSTRALYVGDGVELVVKSMLSGATAQKIFDGSLLHPIQVAEIKQVLLDPIWYETKGFNPSQLPPWPTPSLIKTMKFISWEPQTSLVKGLKETISYFKDNEVKIEIEEKSSELSKPEEKKESLQLLKAWKRGEAEVGKRPQQPVKIEIIYKLMAVGLIIYGLVWPVANLGVSVIGYKTNLSQASTNLAKGDFAAAKKNIDRAEEDLTVAADFAAGFDFLRGFGPIGDLVTGSQQLLALTSQVTASSAHAITGAKDLYQGWQAVTGELTDSEDNFLADSLQEFTTADELAGKVSAQMSKGGLSVPGIFAPTLGSLELKLQKVRGLIEKGRIVATILPQITAKGGMKNYLVLLQNNLELRPTGGFIGSYGLISFEGGKLKNFKVNDIYAIDTQLPLHVEPPREIKEDLGQKDWFLRDANWEPDFPTAARQAEWFFNQETGTRPDGVVALDLWAVEDLLPLIGPIDVPDYSQKTTAENLLASTITHAEQGFSPGGVGKKSFLSALTTQLFNRLFFLPNQNWSGIVSSLDKSLQQKHMLVYLDDPKLFSYMVAQSWAGALPRPEQKVKEGEFQDFLSVVEANLGANKANYYLDRNYQLTTTIGKNGEVTHRLKINYVNRSPSNTWPAGKYKNRMRLYLPFGAKLTRVLVGQTDATSAVGPFADYGRSGYSILVEVAPKESKAVVLDYTLGGNLNFAANKALYRLDIIKQAGTDADLFQWQLNFPVNYKLSSSSGKVVSPQQHSVSTDLSTDRSFKVTFTK